MIASDCSFFIIFLRRSEAVGQEWELTRLPRSDLRQERRRCCVEKL
jgi:hypothetical protein